MAATRQSAMRPAFRATRRTSLLFGLGCDVGDPASAKPSDEGGPMSWSSRGFIYLKARCLSPLYAGRSRGGFDSVTLRFDDKGDAGIANVCGEITPPNLFEEDVRE